MLQNRTQIALITLITLIDRF